MPGGLPTSMMNWYAAEYPANVKLHGANTPNPYYAIDKFPKLTLMLNGDWFPMTRFILNLKERAPMTTYFWDDLKGRWLNDKLGKKTNKEQSNWLFETLVSLIKNVWRLIKKYCLKLKIDG